MKLVIDASVLNKFFLKERETQQAIDLLRAVEAGHHQAFIPSLAIEEVTHSLVKKIDETAVIKGFMAKFYQLIDFGILQVIELSLPLTNRTIELATIDTQGQGHISSYDASYHALALDLDATLVTADLKHIQKTQVVIGHVVSLSEFEV